MLSYSGAAGARRLPGRQAPVIYSESHRPNSVKTPESPAGSETTTTLVRSRTELTPPSPRALPAERKKPICSPGDRLMAHHRAPPRVVRPVGGELRDDRRARARAPAPHLDKAGRVHWPLTFTTAQTVYWSGPLNPGGTTSGQLFDVVKANDSPALDDIVSCVIAPVAGQLAMSDGEL